MVEVVRLQKKAVTHDFVGMLMQYNISENFTVVKLAVLDEKLYFSNSFHTITN